MEYSSRRKTPWTFWGSWSLVCSSLWKSWTRRSKTDLKELIPMRSQIFTFKSLLSLLCSQEIFFSFSPFPWLQVCQSETVKPLAETGGFHRDSALRFWMKGRRGSEEEETAVPARGRLQAFSPFHLETWLCAIVTGNTPFLHTNHSEELRSAERSHDSK